MKSGARVMKKSAITLGLAAAALLAAAPAHADGVGKEAGSILVRAHALGVVPQPSASVSPIGGDISVTDTVTPEVDFSYFFTQNIAVELIAASPQHTASSSVTGGEVVEARLLPPTLTVQYHFLPQSDFSPYVGAGINYTWFYDVNPKGGLPDASIDNGFGAVIQAGVDYAITDRFFVNFDIKQVFLNTKVKLAGGAVTADLDLNPTLIGFGFGYRF
jgi:outer membrane protein